MTNGHESANGKIPHAEHPAGEHAAEHDRNWIEKVEEEIEEAVTQPPPVLFLRVLKFDLPYLVMLTAAFFGIGASTFTGSLLTLYWEAMVPLYCAICIYTGWRGLETREERVRLVWTQIAHWLTVLLTMYVIYLPQVRDVLNVNAAGLTLMAILALATILAGIHAEAWQICVVGLILAVAVPIMAWIQQSALMMTIGVIGVVFFGFVGASIWWTTHKEKKSQAA
jgi:hypothetical protein